MVYRLSLKRLGLAVLAIAVAVAAFPSLHFWQQTIVSPNVVHAGDITSPTWSLSSTTEGATGVTYTHSFTTATALPVGGVIDMELFVQQPGPGAPDGFLPKFPSNLTVGSGSTASLVGLQVAVFSFGGPHVNLSIFNGNTALPAGNVTVVLNGVTNPTNGGLIITNTSTGSNGSVLDGQRGSPDGNGKLIVGSVKLSGKITNTSGQGIAGVPLEIHPGPTSTTFGFWRTVTDSEGNYAFAGLANGSFIFEMSPGDPGSKNASSISQYARFDPLDVTISSTAQVINKTLAQSQKVITGKVFYEGTTTPVVGAMVNAGSFGPGGFANGQTDSAGSFTLRMATTGNVFLMIQPMMGGGQQGQQQQQQPGQQGDQQSGQQQNQPQEFATDFGSVQRQLAFIQGADVAETVNLGTLEVRKADATVTGKIVNPDGSAATGGAGLMNFRDHSFVPMMLDNSGSFSAKVISGSLLKLDSFDPSGTSSLPKVEFVAKKGANDLGTIKKVLNDKTVTITALRVDGGTERPVPNAQAMVFPNEQGAPYFATTNEQGIAVVKVPSGFEGRAGVMPGGSFGGGPKNEGPGNGSGGQQAFLQFMMADVAYAEEGTSSSDLSQLFPVTGFQRVVAGDSITVKFDKADKTVNIRTIDSNGVLVTDGAFVEVRPVGGNIGAHFGCPTAGGLGTCHTVSGKMEFRAMFPPDSEYAGKAVTETIVTDNQTVNVTVVEKTVTITGEVQDGSNNNSVIKDATLEIQVGAFGDGMFSFGSYNPSTGTYSMKVAPDAKVRLGVAAGDPGRGINKGGYVPTIDPTELIGTNGQTLTKNLVLSKVDATIKGKITDDKGNPLEGVPVVADPGLANIVNASGIDAGPGPGPDAGPEFGFNGITDDGGNYTINVSANTYNMVVKALRDQSLFDTSVHQTTIKSGETKTVDIQLVKANSTLQIDVNKADNTDLKEATVQFFNDKGTIALSIEDGGEGDKDGKANGVVMVDVPADTYNVKAGQDFDSGKVEESGLKKMTVTANQTVSQTLQTVAENNALPKSVTTEVSSSSATAVALVKGSTEEAALSIPAGALSSSSGSEEGSSGDPILSVDPIEGELPQTKAATTIGSGMSVKATDANGNAITSLAGIVSGTIHYQDSDIPIGIDENKLNVNSYNATTGQWEAVQSSVVDTAANVVTFTTNHFTDFAIVTTSDTTAPSNPASITATADAAGSSVTLRWTNPTESDFDHLNVYRSTTDGQLGSKVKTTAKADTSYQDTGLTNGTKYFYTLRAVDVTGNESANTTQVSATSNVVTLPKTGSNQSSSMDWLALLVGFGAVAVLVRFVRYGKTI